MGINGRVRMKQKLIMLVDSGGSTKDDDSQEMLFLAGGKMPAEGIRVRV